MRRGSGPLWASETHGIFCEALESLPLGVANEMANGGPFDLLPQPPQWWCQSLPTQNRVASFLNPDGDSGSLVWTSPLSRPLPLLHHLNFGAH